MALAVLPVEQAHDRKRAIPDPKNYKVALLGPDDARWAIAEQEKLATIEANKTWTVIKRPKNVKPIPTKWVYEIKMRTNGTVERYKARLAGCGDKHIFGVN